MTALEIFTKNNDGDWIGGEQGNFVISIKHVRARFSDYERFQIILRTCDIDSYLRSIVIKSFSTRHEAQAFAEKFARLLNEFLAVLIKEQEEL